MKNEMRRVNEMEKYKALKIRHFVLRPSYFVLQKGLF
jgi:hypothetical protein